MPEEHTIFVRAQALVPEEQQDTLDQWAAQPHIRRVLHGINESILMHHEILETTHLDIEFRYIAPEITKQDLQNVLDYLVLKGYTITPVALYDLIGDERRAVIGIRLSWSIGYTINTIEGGNEDDQS